MKNLFLAAGVAALAIAVPSAAQPGGKGGEKRANASKVERGQKARSGQANRQKARSANREKARSAGRAKARAENRQRARTSERRQARAERQADRRADRGREARADRQADRRVQRARNERAERVRDRREARANAVERRRDDRAVAERLRDRRDNLRDRRENLRDRRERLVERRDRDLRYRNFDRDRFDRRFALAGPAAAYLDGCPPGLAKQNELCMPPGQYKKLVGQRLPDRYTGRALPIGLRDYYRDTDDYYYRYGDGYLYRVDRDQQLIRAIMPLLGAGLGIGMQFPYNSSPNYYVPSSYQSFYPDSPYSYYRYANGYVYEIDRGSGMIEDVIPLLDQGYGVGQMLPASYSYYNVPDPYRSWYTDNDDYYYRYAPGAIYQVDRDTQLITAIASLLTGTGSGFAVGQPLPMGYDMYNVPYGYRDRYYDTADSWYRYNNGNIYQVDPTTRLITAIVSAIV